MICLSRLPSWLFKQRRTSFVARQDFQFPRTSIFQFLCVTHFRALVCQHSSCDCGQRANRSDWCYHFCTELFTCCSRFQRLCPYLNLAAAVEQVDLKVLLCYTQGQYYKNSSVFIWLSGKTSLVLKEVFKAIVLCYLCTGQQHSCNPNASYITSTKHGLCWTLTVFQTAEFYCQTSATKPMIPLTFPRFCLAMLMCC